ncbi:MAG: hypothetical protein ACU841_15470 [Gammaproteobacteria bacterium]
MIKQTMISTAAVLLLAALTQPVPVLADKPSWAGGKQERHQQQPRHYDRDGRRGDGRDRSYHDRDREVYHGGHYFADRHRMAVRNYYQEQYRRGRCPPGLAKKSNGCMPPGMAKRWAIGRPLPRDLIFHDLPPAILSSFGMPPPGYRFVRVASDILMIAVGTGMVMDAIDDLGRW